MCETVAVTSVGARLMGGQYYGLSVAGMVIRVLQHPKNVSNCLYTFTYFFNWGPDPSLPVIS